MNISNQPEIRKNALQTLEIFLKENFFLYPFLLLGEAGSGKSFWIKQIAEKILFHVIEKNALAFQETEHWEETLTQAHKGVLVINNVELFPPAMQNILMEFLKELEEDRTPYKIKLILTSTHSLKELRATSAFVPGFIERISLLSVRLPNLKEIYDKEPQYIRTDLQNLWQEEYKEDAPFNAFYWLETHYKNISGNFWYLKKVMLAWKMLRTLGKSNLEIQLILARFLRTNVPPVYSFSSGEETFRFQAHKNEKYEDILVRFRREIKKWAKQTYGDLKKAAEILGISHRSMERW